MALKTPNLMSDLRLRTKLLFSYVLITACLSCATLLAVRYSGQNHARQEVAAGAHTSLLTFDVLFHQHQNASLERRTFSLRKRQWPGTRRMSTRRKALPTLWNRMGATLSGGGWIEQDRRTSCQPQEFSNNGNAGNAPPVATERVFVRLVVRRRLPFQVALQPIGHGSGTIIVGREIDYRTVHDMGRISASQVVFSYDRNVVASTFRPIEEEEAGKKLQNAPLPGQIEVGDDQFFADSLQLNSGSGPAARLTVLKSYSEATAFLTDLNHLLLGLGFLAVLAGAGLVFLISDAFTRPLANLLEGFRALERGDYAYPLHAHGGDEVAHATRAFDRMRNALQKNEAEKQQLEDQLRQSQKMEALGRLAGGVAHDFNNLLTVIKGHSELITDRVAPADPVSMSGQQIRKAADRAATLTRQMLAFSRRQALQPKVLNVNAVVEDIGKLVKRLIPEDIEVIFRPEESLGRVKADASQLEQVLLNLTLNARDAMPRGGKVIIETRNVRVNAELARTLPSVEPGDYVKLAVIDTGTGMDAETKAHIFEPFFTTKEPGKGTGLGLATVYGVVKQTGGFICVDSEIGIGSKFEVYLPRVDGKLEVDVAPQNSPAQKVAPHTVLLAEDEAEVRAVACEFLTSAGFRVLTAEDGVRALQIAEHDNTIDILVTDM